MSIPADRNLLVGILALQMEFTDRRQLLSAMQAWVKDKTRPVESILLERGALQKDTHDLLVALVEEHLELHGGDSQKSLGTLISVASVRTELNTLKDPDIANSLAHLSPSLDPDATILPSMGASTSAGLRFRVLRPHAEGGLGKVSIALDEELHREIALKEILPQYADDSDARSRFLLEGEITGGLEHPGIVPVYGLGQYSDGRPFYAMRFIRGDSLKDAIDRFHHSDFEVRNPGQRSLELRELLGRFIDVCNAIEYAHSRGILHRDLKPGNIMLGKYGETLVVDWGLAKALNTSSQCASEARLTPSSGSGVSPTMMGSAIGTPAFMPPEQADGRSDILGPASDVYGLGATLYALLTGRAPISGKNAAEILKKVVNGDFSRPRHIKPRISPALEAICLKAMALKPEDRYATPNGIASDIEHWLADEPVAAYAEPWHARSRRWVRRNRAKTVAAAAIMLTLLLSGGIWAWYQKELRVTRVEADAKINSEKANVAVAELKAQTADYLRQRTELDNLSLEKPHGWLARARKSLDRINSADVVDFADAAWRQSSRLQLALEQELVQVAPEDKNPVFPPGQIHFSESGKLAVVSQIRDAAFVQMRMLLYDTVTRQVVKSFPLNTTQATLGKINDFLRSGASAKHEGTVDIIVSEALDVVIALTKGGSLAIWKLGGEPVEPRLFRLGAAPSPSQLALDAQGRRLFVIRHGLVQLWHLDDQTFQPQQEWHIDHQVGDAVWDPATERLLIASGQVLWIINAKAPKEKIVELNFPADRICLQAKERLIFCAGDRTCTWLNADSLTQLDRLQIATEETAATDITDLSISFDGAYMAICLSRGEEHWSELWSLATGQRLGSIPNSDRDQPGFQFKPASHILAKLGKSGLSWWTVDGALTSGKIGMHASPIRDANWSKDGKRVLISRNNSIGSWKYAGQHFHLDGLIEVDGSASVHVSPNGERGLASRCYSGGTGYAITWEEEGTRSQFGRIQNRSFRASAFDPSNKSTIYAVAPPEQKGVLISPDTIKRISLADWKAIAAWNDGGQADILTGRGNVVCLESNSNALFAGLRNGSVRRLKADLSELEAEKQVFSDLSWVSALGSSPPPSDTLAVGSVTGKVAILDAQSLAFQTDLISAHAGSCTSLFWLTNTELVSTGSDGVMKCFRIGEQPQEAWRIHFPSGIIKAGKAGEKLFVVVEGERAIRSYDWSLFTSDSSASDSRRHK